MVVGYGDTTLRSTERTYASAEDEPADTLFQAGARKQPICQATGQSVVDSVQGCLATTSGAGSPSEYNSTYTVLPTVLLSYSDGLKY